MVEKESGEFRRSLQRELETLEHTIYNVERVYLEQTAAYGNLISGWDLATYLKSQRQSTVHALSLSRRSRVAAADRLFSLSSLTSEVHRQTQQESEETAQNAEHGKKPKKNLVKTVGRRAARGTETRDSWKGGADRSAQQKQRSALKEGMFRRGNKSQKNSLKKLKKKPKKN